MNKVWREVKQVTLMGGYVARFYTLFQDARDAMSDSYRPAWEPTGQHRVELFTPNRYLDPVLTLRADKATGNTLYKSLVKATDVGEWLARMERVIKTNGTMTRNIGLHGEVTLKEVL